MPLSKARHLPVATYRLQLNAAFAFADAEKTAPYLRALGISDCYCSPILRSAPGSTHGYDVSDYRKINPELGGGEAFFRLVETLKTHGLSVLLDFVPNHMGIEGPFNLWWRDVLECGPHSPYAHYFDIHWNDRSHGEEPRVLVPILEDHYGRVLEQGKIALRYVGGSFAVACGDISFPLNPRSYPRLLRRVAAMPACSAAAQAALEKLAAAFAALPKPLSKEDPAAACARADELESLKRELAALLEREPELGPLFRGQLAVVNGMPGKADSFAELDTILSQQHYRLTRWKTGAHEINYRRFFAVDTLIGLRMEVPDVFHESHLLLRLLLQDGKVGGVRIDHIDGLWDPRDYLDRLQSLGEAGGKPADPLYVLVEKIAAEDEYLVEDWRTQGTTGYEFIRQVAGVLVDSCNEQAITKTYQTFTGDEISYDEQVYRNKKLILDEMFANAVTGLSEQLQRLVYSDRRWRDLAWHELAYAIRELISSLDVYRTYRRQGEPISPVDRRRIEGAYRRALARNIRADPEPYTFVRDVLTGDYPPVDAPEAYRRQLETWVLTWQQYTGAVMAKSVEDTTFYTYCRFIALNEVGGNPGKFGSTVGEFHAVNAERFARTPHALLSTSTHDTKLSEDVRARLYALSELPAEWSEWLRVWNELNDVHKTRLASGSAPDAIDEYRLYQILLGAWPLDERERGPSFARRIREHVRKAVNEAKRQTSWLYPNTEYLEACDRFVDGLLGAAGRPFRDHFIPRAHRLARLGMVNSLVQVVLKSTVPGVPDFYQGNEIWDFSLVDPDNRRSVDFEVRRLLIERAQGIQPDELLRDWRSGEIKLWVTQKLLTLRRSRPDLFREGDYRPLQASGTFADHTIAYCRLHRGSAVAVVVPRLFAGIGTPPLGPVWDDTCVSLGAQRNWRDVFTGHSFSLAEQVPLRELFAVLPFAVLTS